MMSENNIYRIEAHSYDILGAASHNFWVLRGPDGSIIQELHGLAWDEEKDREKTIGTIGDELRFVPPEQRYGDTQTNASSIMYQGTEHDVRGRWDDAVASIKYLNSLHLPYTPLGFIDPVDNVINSNSAFRIFGEIMGVPI
ncbi:MAG: hypothetical protein KAJ03_03530, partial [Gammaproteobacteria bacterium]|nr:hypothetical protein [Gammaproteobacteria bacterium]